MPDPDNLYNAIDHCMIRDRYALRRQMERLRKKTDAKKLTEWQARVDRSSACAQQRSKAMPAVTLDDSLPVAERSELIREALQKHQVVIIAGETGSGKTTQLPKLCLQAGRGVYGQIGHTQPRRLAARSVAQRIAEELGVVLGEQVGFQVRFNDRGGENTLVKLMTDGILLAEIQHDRFLNRYDTIIIDEAHERSLNIDFLLGYLKLLLPKRRDLKLIITSATIDVERFSTHFDGAPVIEVTGRTYPVAVHYLPLEEQESDDSGPVVIQGILSVLQEIEQLERTGVHSRLGDVLVFLTGEREIRDVAKYLREAQLAHTEVVPLYARLSAAEQGRIFQPHSGRRIILATNVAETSLTVPGIRYVIDPGLARISRYSVRSKVQRLPIEPISQASANQRKGRCGRVSEGVCFRLYAESDLLSRPEYTDAEILRTSLASVILQMLRLNLGDITAFPFVDTPDSRAVSDGFKLLHELGAVCEKRRLTSIGKKLARLPVDPRLARMLLEAGRNRALRELLIITSALSIQDPRERPADKRQAADQRHGEYAHDQSDFLTLVQLWNRYEEQRQVLSQSQLRKYCKQNFLSFIRMREWRELHRQLTMACREAHLLINDGEASYADVHRSLLAGLLSNIGCKDEESDYLGARNRRFALFPTSTLSRRKPKWILTAELMETSRLFAINSACIEPEWIEPLAQHLLRRSHFEPHWEKKRAQVVAYEQVTLYGLTIVARRRVNYGPIDPELSREIFIRQALVEGDYLSKGAFQAHNNALIESVDELESRSRRRDILVDSETLYQFYHQRIPEGIHNGVDFEKWRQHAELKQPELLRLTKEFLMRHEAGDVTSVRYPDTLCQDGMEWPLSYCFEPGQENDGVTLTLPVQALGMLPVNRLQWLVPGLLFDKCVALVRSLPKVVRKNFVPVPDYVRAALEVLSVCDEPLTEALGYQLQRMTGVRILSEQWSVDAVADHLKMNIAVTDEKGRVLGQSRDLQQLKERFREQSSASIRKLADSSLEQEGLEAWTCGALPETVSRSLGGLTLKVYPALVDCKQSVSIRLFDDPQTAQAQHRLGVARLLQFELATQLKFALSKMTQRKQTALMATGFVQAKALDEDIRQLLVLAGCLDELDALPRDAVAFAALAERCKSELVPLAEALDGLLLTVFKQGNAISRKLKGKIVLEQASSLADIGDQLRRLLYPGCLSATGYGWLKHYPRYLQAIELRLEKLPARISQDRAWTAELGRLYQDLQKRQQQLEKHQRVDANLVHYRWMLEEYRVSLFAQKLGTRWPVSDKRLRKLWEAVQDV